MKLLWLTDLHLRSVSEPGHARSVARFRAVLDHALAHHGDADRLIVTGDIADGGTDAQYRLFAALNANTPLTARLLAGNHDRPARLRDLSPLRDQSESGGGQDEIVGAHHLVYLDSHAPGRDSGEIGPDQRAWLDALLSRAEWPVLIFMHHQPAPVFLPGADSLGLEDQREFQDILTRHRDRIAHVFFGHCHRPISGHVGPIPVTGLPAVATQMTANFASADFLPDDRADPCYGVILARGDALACHMVGVSLPEQMLAP